MTKPKPSTVQAAFEQWWEGYRVAVPSVTTGLRGAAWSAWHARDAEIAALKAEIVALEAEAADMRARFRELSKEHFQ